MDFRKISIAVLFGLLIISCSDKKDESVESEPLIETDSAEVDNSESMSFEQNPTMKGWLGFYKKENPDMGLGNFELQKTSKLDMMEGSVSGTFDSDFDSVYMPFLVFNPSKTMYIDLDSYNWVLDENGIAMFEADQEVNLVNLKDKTVKRIGFYGPSYWAEDAFWMNDSVFVLLENSDQNETSFQLINLQENSTSSYINTKPLKIREDFYNDLRLNRKGVKVLH
ncbi:hypothetical protein [Moheibacter sediminis]|uniref:Lipoprotein n=1 Tax=Moheibacter sediminis TaxID=1434700 RepID=A0A1W1YI54_9FLAO|nr:hypothetical protein [Moheibacter sediminis]SMC35428.1 hypothetical protein SAMN06296427_101359 [Moheibacter sediminis]